MDENDRGIVTADPKAYRKEVAYAFPIPLPGGRSGDKDLKASPLLIKALHEQGWLPPEEGNQ